MKALRKRNRMAGHLLVAMALAATASSGAMAYQHPISEVMRSCVQAAKQELHLGNYDVIGRDFGVNHKGRKAYDVYFNLELRDELAQEAVPMKVHCSSEGFGKVRNIDVEEGSWGYRFGPQQQG